LYISDLNIYPSANLVKKEQVERMILLDGCVKDEKGIVLYETKHKTIMGDGHLTSAQKKIC
jgi:hypothetical protein